MNLGDNGKEEVLHISEIFKAAASPSYYLMSKLGHSFGKVLPLCRDVVSLSPVDWAVRDRKIRINN